MTLEERTRTVEAVYNELTNCSDEALVEILERIRDSCYACGRVSLECSEDPCPQVIADRGEVAAHGDEDDDDDEPWQEDCGVHNTI